MPVHIRYTGYSNFADATADDHPEAFEESLQQLLPDLSELSEIEVHLLFKD
jgi:precorrin-8X/cobalt-precorrin-8 methylmutase